MFGRLPWLALLLRILALRFFVFFDMGSDSIVGTPPVLPAGARVAGRPDRWFRRVRPGPERSNPSVRTGDAPDGWFRLLSTGPMRSKSSD